MEIVKKRKENTNKEHISFSVLEISLPVRGAIFSTTTGFSSSTTFLVGSSGFTTGCGLDTFSVKKDGIEVL